jgi:hypothetical protein
MPVGFDDETNLLITQKHILIRQLERKEISQEEFDTRIKEIESKVKISISKIIGEETEKRIKQEEEEERRKESMANEGKVVGEKKPAKERAPRKDSRASVIIDVLKMKSIKNMDETVDKVVEKMPGQNPKNVRLQVNTIVGLVKKQTGKWAKYSWNEEAFLLSDK